MANLLTLVIYTHYSSSFPISFMFGGSSEYTAFHDVSSVHIFLFFTKGTVRELQDSNSVKMFGQAVMSSAKSKRRHSLFKICGEQIMRQEGLEDTGIGIKIERRHKKSEICRW